MKKLLYISVADISFLKRDLSFLSEKYDVIDFKCGNTKGLGLIKLYIRYLFIIPYYHFKGVRNLYIWFADYHSFPPLLLAKIFGWRSTLVIGGYDLVGDNSLSYGSHINIVRSTFTKWSMTLAQNLIAISDYVEKTLVDQFRISKSSISKIYNCCSFTGQSASDRDNVITTVCSGSTLKRLKVKGIDYFLDLAKVLPLYKFQIVGLTGVAKEEVLSRNLSNVVVLPYLTQDELTAVYNNSKVICQISRYETFGISVIEGIMCNAIPIVSNEGGLPEILNYMKEQVVDNSNLEQIKEKVIMAIDSYENFDFAPLKKHIAENYSCKERKDKLIALV